MRLYRNKGAGKFLSVSFIHQSWSHPSTPTDGLTLSLSLLWVLNLLITASMNSFWFFQYVCPCSHFQNHHSQKQTLLLAAADSLVWPWMSNLALSLTVKHILWQMQTQQSQTGRFFLIAESADEVETISGLVSTICMCSAINLSRTMSPPRAVTQVWTFWLYCGWGVAAQTCFFGRVTFDFIALTLEKEIGLCWKEMIQWV